MADADQSPASTSELSPKALFHVKLRGLSYEPVPTRVAGMFASHLAFLKLGALTSGGETSHRFVTVDGYPLGHVRGQLEVPGINFPWELGLVALQRSVQMPFAGYTVHLGPKLVPKKLRNLPPNTRLPLPEWDGWTIVRFGASEFNALSNGGAILLVLGLRAIWLMRALKDLRIIKHTFVVPRGSELSPLYVTFDTQQNEISVTLDRVPVEECTLFSTSL